MESQETPNPGETPEVERDTSADAEAQKKLRGDAVITDSSTTSEQAEGNEIYSPSSEEDNDAARVKEHVDPADQKIAPLPSKKRIGIRGILGMSQTNEKIYNNLVEVYKYIIKIYNENRITYESVYYSCKYIKAALDLINRLSNDKEKLRDQLAELEQDNRELGSYYESLKQQNKNLVAERDGLLRTRQILEEKYKELQAQYRQKAQEVETVKGQKESLEGELKEQEASKSKLLAEVARLKLNTGTHYDGTSERPQHHVLTGEYKTLKEQHLDPLATSLFTFMATLDPELKKQRKQKVNDIKAAISATVLIEGQAIMRGESTGSVDIPSEMLEEMQSLLCQKLQLNNQEFPPEAIEFLKKAVNRAQGKVEYPEPGKWQEKDFNQASAELMPLLYQELKLDLANLSPDLQTETQKAIQNALHFLERAACADPAADLRLDNEGASFRIDYHEAAKGWDDEGTVIKTIYPVYLVNGKAKVKAVVLTEPSSEASHPSTINNTPSSTESESSHLATTTKSTEGKEDEERIRLEAKRESLINGVKAKWFYSQYSESEARLLEKLSRIERRDVIEELEIKIHKSYNPNQFEEKLDELLADSSSQQNNE
ncbi:MAG: hypothetical protein GDA48_28640 [Hormoscilla sp. GM102CHS1]|nr:hypothetical protein [Hormoscilla sp. GM102CHS1]